VINTSNNVISLAEAARSLPLWRGRRVHVTTIARWIDHGVRVGDRRVRLEEVRVGGRRATTREALARFLEAITPRPEATSLPQPAGDRLRQSEAAARRLRAAGI
jgi:hypothetical protein